MLLKESFHKIKKQHSIKIPRKKLFIGVVFGIWLASVFYAFLQLFRKAIIIFDAVLNDYELFLFTEEANQFYNFLFAFIAVFFSFSIVFVYLFDVPKKFLSKYNYKRNLAINQLRTTNWYFFNWFSRIAYLIGLLALNYEGLNVYSENTCILILFFLVFTSQIWISIRVFLQKNVLKWFLVVFFSCFLFSFGLSKVDIINTEKLDKSILEKNVFYKHNVHVVSSEVASKELLRHFDVNIVVPKNKNNQTLIFNGKEIKNEELEGEIIKHKSQFSIFEEPFINYVLHIDSKVSMNFIIQLKKRMRTLKIERYAYAAKKPTSRKPFYYKSEKTLKLFLHRDFVGSQVDFSKEIFIKVKGNNTFLFNQKTISGKELTTSLKYYFNESGVKSIRVFMSKNTPFYEYFQVLESSKNAINQLRNEYSQNGYATDFSSLTREQQKFIKEKYRWHVIDEIKDY